MKNLELFWKILVYHNKPMSFRIILNYLGQKMNKTEIYRTINWGLICGIVDKTEKNQLVLATSSILEGKKFRLYINPSLDEVKAVNNTKEIVNINANLGMLIIPIKKTDAIETKSTVKYNFQNLCYSLKTLSNVTNNLIGIESPQKKHGYVFNAFSNQFDEFKSDVQSGTVLFRDKIGANYFHYFFQSENQFYAVPENNWEIIESLKLLVQFELKNKFVYDKELELLTCKYVSIPYLLERIFMFAHIMNEGNISINRCYRISLNDLNFCNKIIFENRLNITYE